MKYHQLLLFAFSCKAQQNKIIGTNQHSVAEAIDKLIPEHAAEIKLHGCHCAFYSDTRRVNGKGNSIDAIDQICLEWSRAKACVEKQGRECSGYDLSGTYDVSRYDDYYECPSSNTDVCQIAACQLDTHFASKLRAALTEDFNATITNACPYEPCYNCALKDACCGNIPNLQAFNLKNAICLAGELIRLPPSRRNCPAGTGYNIETKLCEYCDAGKFSAGSAYCTDCADGSNSGPGASECTICEGEQIWDLESFQCVDCSDGTVYDVATGTCVLAPSLENCPDGTGFNSGENYCEPCQENYFSPGSALCTPCVSGSFSSPGSSACVTCGEEQIWDSDTFNCMYCPEGTAFDAASGTCSAGLQEILSSGQDWKKNSLGFFVHVSDGTMTWDAAQTYCQNLGAGSEMAMPANPEQNRIFLDSIKAKTSEFGWWGFKRFNAADTRTWNGADMRPVTWTSWCGGEPNNAGGNERCAMTWDGNTCWNDIYCGNSYRAICVYYAETLRFLPGPN